MRLILLAVLFYLLYRLIRGFMGSSARSRQEFGRWRESENIDDEMVKDPQCNTYFPKRDMIPYEEEGKILYFHSEECKSEYIRNKKDASGDHE